ncbi:unnamed protein product [Leptosia nina]|uniref:Cytochrome P450 n=1 Tax=Leptosia nina TaxID=320188 RepID=A0AAV1JXZ0_9NEOP
MANKVSGSEDDGPLFGIAIHCLGDTEHIMNKLQEYSCVTTSLNGFAKAWLGPLLYYMITDPEKIEYVLKHHLEKDNLHRFIRYIVGYASIFAPVSIWRPRRKISVPVFSPKIISSFVDVFSVQSDKLSRKLKVLAGTGNFKIWSYINAYSLDAVLETAMGVQINAQDNHENSILTATNHALYYACERIFQLWLQPDWLYKFFPQHAKLKSATKVIHEFTDGIIQKKREQIEEEKKQGEVKGGDAKRNKDLTFLDQLVTQSGGANGYSDVELREEVLTFIVAAMDTSAVTMGFTLKLLSKYPEVQQKVFDELDALFGDSDRLLVKEDLPKLPYLERVIKETLRLFPSVPFIIREASEHFITNDGIPVPKGSGLITSIWGVHRNPKYWGSDAHCFDPDRFLPERCKNLHPCAFIPFSHGPRNCLGYQYAMMSMKTALSSILRRYRVVGVPEKGPVPHIRVKLEIMMKAVDGFEVALEER